MITISGLIKVLTMLLAVSLALAATQFIAYFRSINQKNPPKPVKKLPELEKAKALRTTST